MKNTALENVDDELREAMYKSFQELPKDQQIRRILLAGNAEFVLRMTEGSDYEPIRILREALTRYL